MEELIEKLISQWAIPSALKLSHYITDECTKAYYQVQCYHYMNQHHLAYPLLQKYRESFLADDVMKQWYSLVKSIYRYRYKHKVKVGQDCYVGHQMLTYLFPPFMYDNKIQIADVVTRYTTALKWLTTRKMSDFAPFHVTLDQLINVSFPLSYQGVDLSGLQRLKNQVFCKFFNIPTSRYTFALPSFGVGKNKIRIGFITLNFIKDHAVMRDRLGLIQNLDRKKFDVFILCLGHTTDINFGEVTYLHLHQASITTQEDQITNCGLDILFYCDLSMDSITYRLASQRLCPVQVTTWGHSDTSGCREIDYYISSKYFVPNTHIFTERTILFSSLSTYYNPLPHMSIFYGCTAKVRKYKARRILRDCGLIDLNDDAFVMIIGSNPRKIHPSFQKILNELILETTDQLLLPTGKHEAEADCIISKHPHLPFVKLPALETMMYSIVLCACDVFLDPFPFGSCNSAIECFGFGVPFVTRPSKFQYGNFVRGFIEYSESKILTELIVASASEYAEKVDDLRDDDEQEKYSTELIARYPRLLHDHKTIKEYENFFISTVMALDK